MLKQRNGPAVVWGSAGNGQCVIEVELDSVGIVEIDAWDIDFLQQS